jgi:hypothetical protein
MGNETSMNPTDARQTGQWIALMTVVAAWLDESGR